MKIEKIKLKMGTQVSPNKVATVYKTLGFQGSVDETVAEINEFLLGKGFWAEFLEVKPEDELFEVTFGRTKDGMLTHIIRL